MNNQENDFSHLDATPHYAEPQMGSDKSFGIIFSVFFILLASLLYLIHGYFNIWLLTASVVFLAISFGVPTVLRPLNIVWFKIGNILHCITNPIIMGFIFFMVLLPTSLLMRLLGKVPIDLKIDKKSETYWIAMPTKDSKPESMRNQF